ncbi:MAG TPA: hypothetical protein VH835_06645 [Dongiaceae bacterium]
MREPMIDLESAAAKRETAAPAKPFLVPTLRADRDLNLTAEDPDDREPPPAVILPNEPVLPVTPAAVAPPAAGPWQPPVLGSLAVIFGIAALFKATLLLGPLALAFAFLAALGRQFSWAAIGGIAGLAALATSPWFWGIVGLAWVIDYLGLGSWYTSFL